MRALKWTSLGAASLFAGGLVACSGAGTTSNDGTSSGSTDTGSSVDLAAQTPATAAAPASVATSTIRKRVQAGVSTEIGVSTSPEASCTLHGPTGEAPTVLHLFADAAGVARFHAKPAAGLYGVAQMLVDCTARDGTTTTTALEVESVAQRVAAEPVARLADSATVAKAYAMRPALTENDYTLPARELVARGYAPAPDGKKSPAALAAWLKSASTPALRVPSTHVLDTGRTHTEPWTARTLSRKKTFSGARSVGTTGATPAAGVDTGSTNTPDSSESNNIWSGYVLLDAPAYSYVMGSWAVPAVSGDGSPTSSSTWVGLDGYGTSDLIQTGTRQDTAYEVIGCGGACTGNFEVDVYYAWYEYYPAREQRIYDVAPGDFMSAYVYSGDAYGNITTNGPYMWFNITDSTTGVTQQQRVDKPSNAPDFSAYSAEWIQERPSYNGVPTRLASYNNVVFTGTLAYDPNDNTLHDYQTDFSLAVTMVSATTGDVLSWPYSISENSFGCYWANAN